MDNIGSQRLYEEGKMLAKIRPNETYRTYDLCMRQGAVLVCVCVIVSRVVFIMCGIRIAYVILEFSIVVVLCWCELSAVLLKAICSTMGQSHAIVC